MNETVLYRKYRPSTWKEVLDQEHIVKVLEGSIKLDRVSHAYLFAGGRGTGKTSLARLFARELGTADEDIYEMDAASNRGVDDIREVRDSVMVSPFKSKYKVYIIDEVHMLTDVAFNALLKTLEEPPKHVIFILATTEPEALPDTIVSRCQVFNLKKPSREALRLLVESISKKEGFVIETGVSELIAGLGDGSFRDTLSFLQKTLSFSKDKKISLKEVEEVSGAPRAEIIRKFIKSLSLKDKESALEIVNSFENGGQDSGLFIDQVLDRARDILLCLNSSKAKETLKEKLSKEDFDLVSNSGMENKDVIRLITEFIGLKEKIKRNSRPFTQIELSVISILI